MDNYIAEKRVLQQSECHTLNIVARAKTYCAEGKWVIKNAGHSNGLFELGKGGLSFNYLVVIDNVNHLILPDDCEEFRTYLSDGSMHKWDLRIISPDGVLKYLQGSGKLVTPRGTTSERRTLEQANFTRKVLETSPDIIQIVNIDNHRGIYLNKMLLETLGYDFRSIKQYDNQAGLEMLIHPDDLPHYRHFQNRFKTAADDEVISCEIRVRDGQGQWQSFRHRGKVFNRDSDGAATRYIVFLENIAALKKAEEELRSNFETLQQTQSELLRAKEKLAQRAEDKYRELFDSIDEGFCIIEVLFDADRAIDYRFIETNPAFEKLTGLKNVDGRLIKDILPDYDDHWLELFGEVARTRQAIRFDRKVHSLGERWYEVYVFPTGNDSAVNQIAVLYTDITERYKQEQHLKEFNTKLREADKAKSNFFSNVSHEFRTPLTLLLSPLDDILKNSGSKMLPEDLHKLQLVYRNAVRLQKLVNTLLDFSRIEAGKIEAFYQPTDIVKFTADLASNFRSAIEKAGLKYLVKTQNVEEPVYVNREMWEKIVLNLISNAFKFTQQGRIEVVLRSKKKHVQLHVRDTGVGISEQNMPKIFERFVRIEGVKARTFEGSGIGLALVKELVSLHGGTIKVKSDEGAGSEFIVTIPKGKNHFPARQIFESKDQLPSALLSPSFVEEAMSWLPQMTTKRSSMLQSHRAPSKRRAKAEQPMILIADDNADMREYLTYVLGDGYRVDAVENGQKVIDYVTKGNRPDLILADVMMPELDGYQVVERLKTDPKHATIPIILLSARCGEDSKIEGLEIGADDYLIKPFSARELLALVSSRITIASLRNVAHNELTSRNTELEQSVHEKTEALEESRSLVEKQNVHLQKVLDAIPQMVWVLDGDGRIRFVNDRWFSYTGITSDQCLDLQAKQCDIFHPSQKKEIAAKWDELFLKMERYAGEVLIKNEAGQYRWHLDITEPIFDQRGNLEMWVGTFTDVHEEFVKEREVKDTRDLLEAVFNASTNGIAVFDSVYDENGQVFDFHWKYSNQQAQRFAEAHMPEGSNLRELFKKSKAESLIETIKRVVESGEPTAFDYQLEKNGSQVWYHAVAVKLEDGIVLTQQDITDRVKAKQNLLNLNETLKEKNRELKTMNEELTNFAFIASHDLREPLRKIQLFAGQLKDRELSNINERANQYVTKILGAVHRMNDLIEDVLTYSRASVSARPKGVEADLNDVLRQVLTDLSEVIREHDALITHNKLPMFKCNALQISQLLQNMVHNALKFQSGDKQPRVEVNAQIIAGETIDSPLVNPEAQYLKLEVSDNGIGFEQQYADKIFGMFQRLHGRAVFPGTGMGLAICRKIAENHKGFIIARSVLGEGATFTCYLPVQPD